MKGLADHKCHHNQHQLVQFLIHNLRGSNDRVLCKLQGIFLQGGRRDVIGQSSGHQHREQDDGQKCDFEFAAERLPAEIVQAFHAFP
ncbi:hypothetical protein D3C84_1133590 [compost metagenome]